MSDDSTLAGWHKDPSGRHELRFWDGDRWTEHVVDEGFPGLDHPTRSGRAPGGVAPPTAPALPVTARAAALAEEGARAAPTPADEVATGGQIAGERAEIEQQAAAARDAAGRAVREAAERETAERVARADAELA